MTTTQMTPRRTRRGVYEDSEPAMVPCPHCGAEILEDSEQCPRCGQYLSREDSPPSSRSRVWVILLILALVAAVIWTTGR